MRARSSRERYIVLLLLIASCMVGACSHEDGDDIRAQLDASTGSSDAEPQVDGQRESDAGVRDASLLDATSRDPLDASTQMSDGATSMDLCGNLRPATASASGVLPSSLAWLPAVEQHRAVRGRGPGLSVLFGGRLLWLFGETTEKNSGRVIASTSATRASFDRPFVLDETLVNAALPTALWPDAPSDRDAGASQQVTYELGTPIVVGLSNVLVFYSPSLVGSATAARAGERLGTRVTRVRGDFSDNLIVEPEPTLLFPAAAPSFRNGLLAGDGYLYLYGCRPRPAGRFDCLLARAPLGNATRAGAYTYRTTGGWSNDLTVATVVLADMHEDLTVAYNDYLRSYLAVSLHGPEARITLRSAPRPEGPWTALGEVDVPPADAARGEQLGCAVEHHALASQCDKALTLSYVRTARSGEAQLLPLKLELR